MNENSHTWCGDAAVVLQMQSNWADRPLGMRDVFPQQAKLRRELENRLLGFFEKHAFELVSCGAFEYADTLLRGRTGQDAEDWIQLFDASGRAIALRPDMTPSIARMAAPLLASGRNFVRWCYAERVYHRANDPAALSWTSGKAAESTHVGVEWIGEYGTGADCDLLALCQQAVGSLGLQEWQLVVSHAVFAPAFLASLGTPNENIEPLLRCLTQGDYVGFRQQFAQFGIDVDVLSLLGSINPFEPSSLPLDLTTGWPDTEPGRQALRAWDDLVQLAGALNDRGLREGIAFDLTLHRDLTYYTGIVFEMFAPGVGAPIALGGRYDDLLAHFGQGAPAIGFTFEAERLLAALGDTDWTLRNSAEEV